MGSATVAAISLGALDAVDRDREAGYQAASDVAVPIFLAGDAHPAARLMIRDIHRSFQKHGFFRIGTLPIIDCSGLLVEVRDRSRLQGAISGTEKWVRKLGAESIEIRDFSVVLPGRNGLPCLEAGRVEFGPEGVWQLSGGVVCQFDGSARAGVGTLQVIGAEAGNLTLFTPDGHRWMRNIFETSMESAKPMDSSQRGK
jgi:hypothetical protein